MPKIGTIFPFLRSIREFISALRREKDYYLIRPRRATIEVTFRCNLKCPMCSVRKQGQSLDQKELSTGEICVLIDDLFEMGIRSIRFIGAEPLMRRDILDLINYVKKKGMECDIVTNGTLIDEKLASALVASGIDQVAISIDGLNSVHDVVRGVKGAFERVRDGLYNLKNARMRADSSRPKINIRTTISSLNCKIENIENMIGFVEENQIDRFSFGFIREVPMEIVRHSMFGNERIGSTRLVPESGSLLLDKEAIGNIKKALKTNKKLSSYLDMVHYLSDEHLLKGTVPIEKCYQTRTVILVNPYGDVIPCSNLDRYVFGNVRVTSIKKIWNNQRHQALTRFLQRGFFPMCSYCCHFEYTPLQRVKIAIRKHL
nr:radical SAM protein [Desulfobacterales bacterium]